LKITKKSGNSTVSKIKQKIDEIHKAQEELFEGPNDPATFNTESDNKLKDIFCDTRYKQRRINRLYKWRDKHYQKYHSQVKSYDNKSKRLIYDDPE
jgi:hypothetical protein